MLPICPRSARLGVTGGGAPGEEHAASAAEIHHKSEEEGYYFPSPAPTEGLTGNKAPEAPVEAAAFPSTSDTCGQRVADELPPSTSHLADRSACPDTLPAGSAQGSHEGGAVELLPSDDSTTTERHTDAAPPTATTLSDATREQIELSSYLPETATWPLQASDRRPRPFRFFVGGLSQEVEEQEVVDAFSRFGKVLDVRIAKDYATGRRRGFCFVTMEDEASKDAIFDSVLYLAGKRVDLRRENDTTPTDLPRKVFVGGLHPLWATEHLTREFSRFGEVDAVQIVSDDNGRSRCFGFVTFKRERVAESLIGQGSCRIGDRFVEIRKPEPKRMRAQSDVWRQQRQAYQDSSLWYAYSQQQWQAYYHAGFHFHPDAASSWPYWGQPHHQSGVEFADGFACADAYSHYAYLANAPANCMTAASYGWDPSVYRLLGHPAVTPLSELAGLIELLEAAKPCLLNAAGEQQEAIQSVRALAKRSRVLRPILRKIVLIISTPTTSGSDEEEEQAQLLRHSAARVLNSVSQLSGRVLQVLPREAEGCLGPPGLPAVEAASARSRALPSSSRPATLNSHRVAERFILRVFIPHSEKLYAISERLKELSSVEAKSRSAAALASLQQAWRSVHDGVASAGAALLQKVNSARQALAHKDTEREAQRLSALSQYSEKVRGFSAASAQKVNPRHVGQRLDALQEALLKYERPRSPSVRPSLSPAVHEPFSLVEVETSTRLQAPTESLNERIAFNNEIRHRINNLQADTEQLLRQVRSRASVALGLEMASAAADAVDVMAPLHRFQQLAALTHAEGKADRFRSELHRLRELLRKLHREAERLHADDDESALQSTLRSGSP
ncbi:hypothetical protein Efla_005445 [Eimeria flavescens]